MIDNVEKPQEYEIFYHSHRANAFIVPVYSEGIVFRPAPDFATIYIFWTTLLSKHFCQNSIKVFFKLPCEILYKIQIYYIFQMVILRKFKKIILIHARLESMSHGSFHTNPIQNHAKDFFITLATKIVIFASQMGCENKKKCSQFS